MKKIIIMILAISVCFALFAGTSAQKRYEIKSGKMTIKTTSSVINGTSVTYFENYGKKQLTIAETTMSFGETPVTKKIGTLMLADKVYMLYYDTNTYIEDDMSEDGDSEYAKEDAMEEFTQNKIGEEKILGRNCDIFEVDNTKMWIWKGLMLKQEMVAEDQKSTMEVTELKENIKVAKDKFEIPADFSKQQNPMAQMFENMERAEKQAEEDQKRHDESNKKKAKEESKETTPEESTKELKEALKGLKGLFN